MDKINYTPFFFETLNNNSIKYCVLRNYQHLPQSTGGSDLDMVIHKEDIGNFFRAFNSFIKIFNLKIVSVIESSQTLKYCIMSTQWGIQIDVFKGSVFFGKKEIIKSEILYRNFKNRNNVIILEPKIGALLAFLKELLNNKNCKEKYIIDLQQNFLKESIDAQFLSQFKLEFYRYLSNHLGELSSSHCQQLFKIARNSFLKKMVSGIIQKLSRLFCQPGYTIAFLGTDGSGKSTIIESIKPVLKDTFHNAVYSEHMRPNRFPSIARLLGKKEDFNKPVSNPHGSPTSGFLGSLFRWGYYMLDYTIGFYLKIWPKKSIRSCVWIFDRYYYDYLIDPKRARIKLPKWILKFGQFVIPEPDIIICLGADSQTIHQRKPELPHKEVERQVTALKVFCNSHERAVWVDTGKTIEESSKDTMNAIISYMGNRFKNVKLR